MEKILLTGANGFFGSRFYNYYKDKYDIIALTSKDLDVTSEKKVIEAIKSYNPNYVINTAAIAVTDICEREPERTRKINVGGNENIAKACSLSGAKMIYISSEQVYNGNQESGPYTEESIPVPNTNYGRQKLEGEERVKEILNEEVWILRFTWLFGLPERIGKNSTNLTWNIISAALKGEKIKVPANEYRGMTYIYDLLESFHKIFHIPYGIYNIGSENNLNNYEIAEVILNAMGLSNRIKDIVIKDEERYKDNPRDIRISNEKIANLGIEYMETKEAIQRCIKDFNYMVGV